MNYLATLCNHVFYLTSIISNTIILLKQYRWHVKLAVLKPITLRLGKEEYEKPGEYLSKRRF